MVDLLPVINRLLSDIAPVEAEFPSTAEGEFPLITVTEVSNVADFVVDNHEDISNITMQIDVWDNGTTQQLCNRIAGQVSEALTGAGFTRQLGRGFVDTSGLHRNTMYFQVKVINK